MCSFIYKVNWMMQCERSLNIRRGGENKIELTKKEKDRLAELKAKEVKDQKSLTEAEKAEFKVSKAKGWRTRLWGTLSSPPRKSYRNFAVLTK